MSKMTLKSIGTAQIWNEQVSSFMEHGSRARASPGVAVGTSTDAPVPSGDSCAPRGTEEPSEADILCSEFIALVQQRTQEGYEEALALTDRILDLEPGNMMVHEYQALIGMFLRRMRERVEENLHDAHESSDDTPSEVSTEESASEESAETPADDHVSEVPTESSGGSRE